MEAIALNKRKQRTLDKRVNKIKGQLNNGLKLKEEPVKKIRKSKQKLFANRGVIYIGHIPHGFYEDEIRGYCSQFGKVTRLRVARSRKTGRSKGYAFVEFQHADVAKIVAETMNNYLMFNRLLSCQYIPTEKRHSKMFINTITADRFPKMKYQREDTARKNKELSKPKEDEAKLKARRKIEEFKTFFEERGIEFNFKVNDPSCAIPQCNEEQQAVLEIDESDEEVEFSSPANVKKIFKRSAKSTGARATSAKRTKRKELSMKKAFSAKRNKGH